MVTWLVRLLLCYYKDNFLIQKKCVFEGDRFLEIRKINYSFYTSDECILDQTGQF